VARGVATSIPDFALLAAAGFAVSTIVGLTGVGGGAIMTPLLITLFGVPAPAAVGTDLACAAITKTAGTLAHRAARNVATRIVILLALGSVPAAIVTLVCIAAAHLDAHDLDRLIRLSVGIALLASIAMVLTRDWLARWAVRSPLVRAARRYRDAATVLVGVLIGVAVSLTSLGAGAIGAASLALLYPWMQPTRIAGSDIAHAVPLTAVAAAGHLWLGTVNFALLAALLCGGIPGIVFGSVLCRRVPVRVLRVLLAATLALAGAKLLS
jgi:uncharacterized membrane protein YfcA